MVRSAQRPSGPSVSEAVAERRPKRGASPDDASHRRENHEARDTDLLLRDAAPRLLRMRERTTYSIRLFHRAAAVSFIKPVERGVQVLLHLGEPIQQL